MYLHTDMFAPLTAWTLGPSESPLWSLVLRREGFVAQSFLCELTRRRLFDLQTVRQSEK